MFLCACRFNFFHFLTNGEFLTQNRQCHAAHSPAKSTPMRVPSAISSSDTCIPSASIHTGESSAIKLWPVKPVVKPSACDIAPGPVVKLVFGFALVSCDFKLVTCDFSLVTLEVRRTCIISWPSSGSTALISTACA